MKNTHNGRLQKCPSIPALSDSSNAYGEGISPVRNFIYYIWRWSWKWWWQSDLGLGSMSKPSQSIPGAPVAISGWVQGTFSPWCNAYTVRHQIIWTFCSLTGEAFLGKYWSWTALHCSALCTGRETGQHSDDASARLGETFWTAVFALELYSSCNIVGGIKERNWPWGETDAVLLPALSIFVQYWK